MKNQILHFKIVTKYSCQLNSLFELDNEQRPLRFESLTFDSCLYIYVGLFVCCVRVLNKTHFSYKK